MLNRRNHLSKYKLYDNLNDYMAVNVEIKRNKNESNVSTIKRFTKRVQGSGILPRVKSIRYEERQPSDFTKKKARLKSLANKKNYDELFKMGKISGYGNKHGNK